MFESSDDKEERYDYQFEKERKCIGSLCCSGFSFLYLALLAIVIGLNVSWSLAPSQCGFLSEIFSNSSSTGSTLIVMRRSLFNQYIDVTINSVNGVASMKSRSVLGYPMTIDLTSANLTIGDSYAVDVVGTAGHNVSLYNCSGTFIGRIEQNYDSIWSDFTIRNFNSRPIMKVKEKRQISPREFDILDYKNQTVVIGHFAQNPAYWGDGKFFSNYWLTNTITEWTLSMDETKLSFDKRLILFLVSSVSYST